MTRAPHTFSATAFAPTTRSAKTPARAFMRQPKQSIVAFDRLLGDEARSARMVGYRWMGVRHEIDTNANALATGRALH
jgi:hypothetical protein